MPDSEIVGGDAIRWDDCFLDSIEAEGDGFRFKGDFHLRPSHPEHRTAKPEEWACYRQGTLCVDGVFGVVFSQLGKAGWKVVEIDLPIAWYDDTGPTVDVVDFREGKFLLEATDIQFECHAAHVRLELEPNNIPPLH